MLLLLPVLTLPALLSFFFVGFLGPDAHLRFGYLASLPSLVGLPPSHFPGSLSSFVQVPGFTYSTLTPLAVYCAKDFDVIPHPVLFSPYIPPPNLARNVSVYQPWLHPLMDVDSIHVPVQFPVSEAALDFNVVFILSFSSIEFKLWFLAHLLGIIALAVCCPYADLFDCEFFSKRRTITLTKKTLPLTPGDPTLNSTYGRPLFTAAFGSYPCFLAIPTTPDCLPIPIQNEAADIHPSPSDLDSYLPLLQSKIHLNELGSCTPADFRALKICHENGVDNVANKETKPEDCTSGFLPLKETSCDIKLIGSVMDDGDTRYSQLEILEPIAVDCSLEPISNEPSVDKSNIRTSSAPHLKASMAKQKCEESAPESVFPLAFDNTSTNTAKTCILSFSSAIEPSHSGMGHKPSYCIEYKLEKQMENGNAYGVEQTINDINDSTVTISSSSPPILTESSSDQAQTAAPKPVLSVDPVTNCTEKTSEFNNLNKRNLTECEVKVERKRGCRGGVRSSKRIAARRQAAAKNELEYLQCASVEAFTLENPVTDSLLIDLNPPERDCVEAESNLLVFDPSSCPRESDTSNPPITPEIQSMGAELQVDESSTPGGKTLKPGYIRKRGCRGKKKSSKQQLQYPCDNLSPIQVEL